VDAVLAAGGGHVAHLKDAVAFVGGCHAAGERGDLVVTFVE